MTDRLFRHYDFTPPPRPESRPLSATEEAFRWCQLVGARIRCTGPFVGVEVEIGGEPGEVMPKKSVKEPTLHEAVEALRKIHDDWWEDFEERHPK